MDEQVLRSLIKWPDVPDCFGWLALDRRGQWRMRDAFAQQNKLSGQVITHLALNEFISRKHFQKGRMEASIKEDPYVKQAIDFFKNTTKYNQILGIN